jgi:hypothetical protein
MLHRLLPHYQNNNVREEWGGGGPVKNGEVAVQWVMPVSQFSEE